MSRGLAPDAAGAALVGSTAAWTLVAASRSGGDAVPVLALLAAASAAYAVGRVAGMSRRWLVPLCVVGGVAAASIGRLGQLPAMQPLTGPLEYTNASAAMYLQGAIASAMLAFCLGRPGLRAMAIVSGLGLGAAALLSMSRAVDGLLLLSLVVLLVAARGSPRLAVSTAAFVFAVALMATTVIGTTWPVSDPSLRRVAEAAIGERRVGLWHDAAALMREHPWIGVGPGRFQEASPTARADRDARWAHHGFLQQGAEGGVVGLVLSVAVFVWALALLWATPRADVVTALGAAAVASLGVHATVDYVLHFPWLAVVGAALAATGATTGSEARARVEEETVVGELART